VLERDIQKACLRYLDLKGIFAWRQNTAGVYNPKTDSYRFHGLRGVSDILGCLPDGKLLAVEVKQPGNKPTPDQNSFLNNVAERGGIACCVHSVDELADDLKSCGY
jgi:hypothetical protein